MYWNLKYPEKNSESLNQRVCSFVVFKKFNDAAKFSFLLSVHRQHEKIKLGQQKSCERYKWTKNSVAEMSMDLSLQSMRTCMLNTLI